MSDIEQESIEPLKYQVRNWRRMALKHLPETKCDRDDPAAIDQLIKSLQQQLDEEIQNKKEFERDWLECCEQLSASQKQVEALWNNCRIIYYYEDESYPLEHNKRARKIMREEIEHELSQLKE